MSEDDGLEELRKRRMLELQQKLAHERQQEQAEEQVELQKQNLLRRILTQEARQRLANLKIVRPGFASQLEIQLTQIAQQGRIALPIDDEQLKQILVGLQRNRRDIQIRRV